MQDKAKNLEQIDHEPTALHRPNADLEAVINEQNGASDVLRDNEKLHRGLFKSGADAVALTDLEGKLIMANRQLALLLGFQSVGELLSTRKDLFDLAAPDDRQHVLENAQETLETGNARRAECRLLKNDGATFPVELICSVISDAGGEPKALIGVVRDIAEQLLAREQLDRRLRETVLLNRVIAAGASALEPNAVMEILCRELAHALNVPQAAFARLDADKKRLIVTAEHRARGRPSALGVEIPVTDNLATQYVLENRVPLAVPDAQTDPRQSTIHDLEKRRGTVSLLIVPVLVRDEVVGTIGLDALEPREFSAEEIDLVQTVAAAASPALENARLYAELGKELAERKQAQQRLGEYARDLEARNAELDDFAHTVAHDLQNPLALIIGIGNSLEESYGTLPDTEMRRFLHIMARNGRKMSVIIKELLLLASVRRREEVMLESLDMANIVNEARQSIAHLIAEHEAEIVLPETWPSALGYAPWVEAVWVNYVSNAIAYGGRPPRVELGGSEQADGTIRFWVRDNGPGLTPEEQQRLFKPFERLHQMRFKGHGLGLSIAQRIVVKLGGQVGVESDGVPGRGSVFFFTLPAAKQG